jgi:hypothetical protein
MVGDHHGLVLLQYSSTSKWLLDDLIIYIHKYLTMNEDFQKKGRALALPRTYLYIIKGH